MGVKEARRSRTSRTAAKLPEAFNQSEDEASNHCEEPSNHCEDLIQQPCTTTQHAWYKPIVSLWPWVSWYGPLTFLFWILISAYGLDASHHAQVTTWAFRMAGGLGFRIADEFLALTLFLSSTLVGTERVLRVPFVIAVLMAEAVLLILYVCTRFLIQGVEHFWKIMETNTGSSSWQQQHTLEYTWERYLKDAKVRDVQSGTMPWRGQVPDAAYNSTLITKLLWELGEARKARNMVALCTVLEKCVHGRNVAGVLNDSLYRTCHSGTKELIGRFHDEVRDAILELHAASEEQLDPSLKAAFASKTATTFGNTALCLSGGGGMASYQFGVVRALVELNLLPQVISGSSAGSCVAAHVCVRTREELLGHGKMKGSLHPDRLVGRVTPAGGVGLWGQMKRLLTKGTMLDAAGMTACLHYHCKGNTTFLEAYDLSGRVLNIPVTPLRRGDQKGEPPQILNYLTAPYVTLTSAVRCSCAVPPIFAPQRLEEKLVDGTMRPYRGDRSLWWRDGSFHADIPVDYLKTTFNVSYAIASQVNPHIVPMLFMKKGKFASESARGGWRGGYVLCILEALFKEEINKNWRLLSSLRAMPTIQGCDLNDLYNQEMHGDICLFPKVRMKDFFTITLDPSLEDLQCFLTEGRLMVFRDLIQMKPQMEIAEALKALRFSTDTGTGLTPRGRTLSWTTERSQM